MRDHSWRLHAAAGVALGLALAPASAGHAADFAGENNYQVGCFTLEPPSNQRLSPGLNRGHAEGEWAFCQVAIDGAALVGAEAAVAGAGTYGIDLIVPTYTNFQSKNANGIVDVAVAGSYGGGAASFTDIDGHPFGDSDLPAGHPLIGDAHLLGAFANGNLANTGTVTIPQPPAALPLDSFETGPPLFSNPVTGIRIPVRIDSFGVPAAGITRIDFFFAILFAADDLKRCKGNGGQDFPCETSGNPSADGAAQWFSGPGPLWIGYRPQFTTGIATVPFKILDADGQEPEPAFASIHGIKFCDVNVDGSCSGEKLVNGTKITVEFDTRFNGVSSLRSVELYTGIPGQSSVSVVRAGNDVDFIFQPGKTDGTYWVDFDCSIFPGATGNGVGASTTVTITESLGVFDQQTAPVDDTDNSDGVTASGGVYTVQLTCNDDVGGLDFGNVVLDPAQGDPHTIGFWGASLIKSAINSDPAAHGLCGDNDAPGGNVLPVSDGVTTYTTSDQVATLIMSAAANCAAFDGSINAATVDTTEEKLCAAAGHLPPKQFDNPLGQLLGMLLNVEAGLVPDNALVDQACLGIGADPTPVPLSNILADACLDPGAYQALLDAINNLDPVDGVLPCVTVPTCPADPAVIPGATCPVQP